MTSRSHTNRFFALGTLAAYLLAWIVAPYCHNHSGSADWCAIACNAAGHAHSGCEQHHEHDGDEHDARVNDAGVQAGDVHGGHCAACEFIAQQAVAGWRLPSAGYDGPCVSRVVAIERLPVHRAALFFSARGPPGAV